MFQGTSFRWLKTFAAESVNLIFAEPPYNINKTDWNKFESQEKYIECSMRWIEQAARILTAVETLYICGFSDILADLKHPSMKFFKSCKWLVWYCKNKANPGNDWDTRTKAFCILEKAKSRLLIAIRNIAAKKLQLEGKRRMATRDFLNGILLRVGTEFGGERPS